VSNSSHLPVTFFHLSRPLFVVREGVRGGRKLLTPTPFTVPLPPSQNYFSILHGGVKMFGRPFLPLAFNASLPVTFSIFLGPTAWSGAGASNTLPHPREHLRRFPGQTLLRDFPVVLLLVLKKSPASHIFTVSYPRVFSFFPLWCDEKRGTEPSPYGRSPINFSRRLLYTSLWVRILVLRPF